MESLRILLYLRSKWVATIPHIFMYMYANKMVSPPNVTYMYGNTCSTLLQVTMRWCDSTYICMEMEWRVPQVLRRCMHIYVPLYFSSKWVTEILHVSLEMEKIQETMERNTTYMCGDGKHRWETFIFLYLCQNDVTVLANDASTIHVDYLYTYIHLCIEREREKERARERCISIYIHINENMYKTICICIQTFLNSGWPLNGWRERNFTAAPCC